MTKAELIDQIAKDAKVTKAAAGRPWIPLSTV